ncbi:MULTISPECIES: DUF2147 domain-containing protein [Sphingomonas]|uniref:DUF2147 domain-containing protein n=1 Tax=Sphingomonas TaxID=13687 RepID=UPI0013B43CE2|nr:MULTISPECIES: DUF2147 domain-containing protein [Sphingomonas]
MLRTILACSVLWGGAAEAASVAGKWINPSRSVIIDIKPSGGRQMCGVVVWASEQAKRDARRGTPHLVGTQLLTGLHNTPDGWRGNLFVPDVNLRASAKLSLEGNARLKVSGCKAVLCKTQLWARTNRSRA